MRNGWVKQRWDKRARTRERERHRELRTRARGVNVQMKDPKGEIVAKKTENLIINIRSTAMESLRECGVFGWRYDAMRIARTMMRSSRKSAR